MLTHCTDEECSSVKSKAESNQPDRCGPTFNNVNDPNVDLMDRDGTICRNLYILQLIQGHLFQSKADCRDVLEATLQAAAAGVLIHLCINILSQSKTHMFSSGKPVFLHVRCLVLKALFTLHGSLAAATRGKSLGQDARPTARLLIFNCKVQNERMIVWDICMLN